MIFCLIAAGAQADIRIQPSSPDFLIAEDFADGMLIVQTFTNPPRIDTLFLSTDNGETWEWFGAGESSDTLLTYVFSFASDGDSSFFYALFDCSDELPHNLWLEMINRISSIGFFGYIQPDEVNAHYASGCTDHFRSGHWIYICVVDTNPPTPAIALMFLRSTDYGNDWFPLVDSYPILVRDPHLAAGAGHRIYFAGVTGNSNDTLIIWTNLDRLDPAQWVRYTMSTDGDRIEAPLLAASFNPVDSLATVWCAYARNRNNSGNWDIECVYSTDGGINWSEPVALAGSPNFEERYFDLKPNRHFNRMRLPSPISPVKPVITPFTCALVPPLNPMSGPNRKKSTPTTLSRAKMLGRESVTFLWRQSVHPAWYMSQKMATEFTGPPTARASRKNQLTPLRI